MAAVQGWQIEGTLAGSPLGFAERWERFLDALMGEGWLVFGPAAETESEGPLTGMPLPYARRYRLTLWREGASESDAREAVKRAERASGSGLDAWFDWLGEVREIVVEPTLVELGDVTRGAGRVVAKGLEANWNALPWVAAAAGLWALARMLK